MEGLRVRNIFWTPPWQKNLEQFLLIQQFWLMGTTSIPQPVITTAQFPISASHAGMPRKSSLWSPIFRHFSGPSPARFLRACRRTWRKEIAPRSKTGDLNDGIISLLHNPPLTPKSRRMGIVGKKFEVKHPRNRGAICLFCSIPGPGFDWQPMLARVAVSSVQRPGNRPFPFRGCPWNPQRISAMLGRRPGIHWNYNSHCQNSGWMWSNLFQIQLLQHKFAAGNPLCI